MPEANLPTITTISETRPLARFPHLCTVCGQSIAIGSYYSRIVLRNHDTLNPKKALAVIKWHLPYCPEGKAPARPQSDAKGGKP